MVVVVKVVEVKVTGMIEARIVFTNGCFDVIHSGHIRLLEYCSSLGDVVVGLNSDQSVRTLKGESRPINSVEDRVLVLESIKFVKKVIVFEELTPLRLIEEIEPDVIVKGGDYNIEDVVGNNLAEVRIFPTVPGKSSSSIIKSIEEI